MNATVSPFSTVTLIQGGLRCRQSILKAAWIKHLLERKGEVTCTLLL